MDVAKTDLVSATKGGDNAPRRSDASSQVGVLLRTGPERTRDHLPFLVFAVLFVIAVLVFPPIRRLRNVLTLLWFGGYTFCVLALYANLWAQLRELANPEWRQQLYLAGVEPDAYLRNRIVPRYFACLAPALCFAGLPLIVFMLIPFFWRMLTRDQWLLSVLTIPCYVAANIGVMAIARAGVPALLISFCKGSSNLAAMATASQWLALLALWLLPSQHIIDGFVNETFYVHHAFLIAICYSLSAGWAVISARSRWRRMLAAYYTFE